MCLCLILLKYSSLNSASPCTPFCFFTVWQPYVQHQAITHQLTGCNFGSDKEEPTHALVCDALTNKVYIASMEQAIHFVNNQQQQTRPISICHWQALKNKALAYTPVTFEAIQKVGMLEMCVPQTPEHKQRAKELVLWLDKYVKKLEKKYARKTL